MRGFLEFVRERGVVGLAVGFILGGSIAKLVTAFVTDLVNPVVGVFLGKVGGLKSMYLPIAGVRILWGDFVASLIDFFILAVVVYFSIKILRLDKLDRKK